ncbi:hypothetical protein WP50_14015 [Lactiplantibacillus plantarum]|nr:hypothetical protein WP50_14015 [Lactiplantibacillus plantarum]
MPTIREIAAKAGYSPATVSRLLNNDPSFSISDHARKKILIIAVSVGTVILFSLKACKTPTANGSEPTKNPLGNACLSDSYNLRCPTKTRT